MRQKFPIDIVSGGGAHMQYSYKQKYTTKPMLEKGHLALRLAEGLFIFFLFAVLVLIIFP
jgi:hypothetical protein